MAMRGICPQLVAAHGCCLSAHLQPFYWHPNRNSPGGQTAGFKCALAWYVRKTHRIVRTVPLFISTRSAFVAGMGHMPGWDPASIAARVNCCCVLCHFLDLALWEIRPPPRLPFPPPTSWHSRAIFNYQL